MESNKKTWNLWLIRIAGTLLIFAVGLIIGIFVGRKTHRPVPRFTGTTGQHGLQTITIKNGSGSTTLDRDSGLITKIQGSQITITDNANQQQTIVSEGTTLIVGSKQSETFSDLKVGQKISVFGSLDSSNQIEARTIFIE